MIINDNVLKYDEKAIFALRELYSRFGYSQYKMNKFEEYDLYVKNKDFLISDSVITFTDTNGRLMALKPDVTLSIIKNSKDIPGFVQKFYYNENVYRVSERTHSFKEIMQVGLECIGDIDGYCISEVLSLAAQSLLLIDKRAVLDVSHLGILSAIFDEGNIPEEKRDEFMKLMGEKNAHEIERLCSSLEINNRIADILKELIHVYGTVDSVIPKLREMLVKTKAEAVVDELESAVTAVSESYGPVIHIDFSVISDIKYYNGIVFKGFIGGIPQSVLSGGQYERLMRKMMRKSGAVGFAVYLDLLERMLSEAKKYDVDTLILYNESSDMKLLSDTARTYSADGSISVQRNIPKEFTYKKLVKVGDCEVTVLEANA